MWLQRAKTSLPGCLSRPQWHWQTVPIAQNNRNDEKCKPPQDVILPSRQEEPVVCLKCTGLLRERRKQSKWASCLTACACKSRIHSFAHPVRPCFFPFSFERKLKSLTLQMPAWNHASPIQPLTNETVSVRPNFQAAVTQCRNIVHEVSRCNREWQVNGLTRVGTPT